MELREGVKRLAVGIDPGKKGAVCFLDADSGRVLLLADCPILKAGDRVDFDVAAMAALLRRAEEFTAPGGRSMVVLERSMSRPGQGRESIRVTGLGEGIWRGVVTALGFPLSVVHCSTWQHHCFRGQGLKGKAKEKSLLRAKMLFPSLELIPPGRRVPSHDRAEAALMAWYAASLL